jgi:hypothetical protein
MLDSTSCSAAALASLLTSSVAFAKLFLLPASTLSFPTSLRSSHCTFTPHHFSVLTYFPDASYASVSDGALLLFLSETLLPRRTRFALGVQTAVDWRTTKLRGANARELYEGSGGQRLVLGRFGEVVPAVLSLFSSLLVPPFLSCF